MSHHYKKYYDVSRLIIWGDAAADGDQRSRPRLVFGFRDGNPRFTVYAGGTGVENIIAFPSDCATMVGVMYLIKEIIKGPAGEKFAIDSLTSVYVDNKPTSEKRVVGTLYVGKSKEGLIYFSVLAEGKPKMVFTIKTSPYHAFRDGNKNPVPEAKVSECIAMGLVDTMLDVIGQVMVDYTNEEYAEGGRKQGVIKSNGGPGTVSVGNGSTGMKADMIQDLDDLAL